MCFTSSTVASVYDSCCTSDRELTATRVPTAAPAPAADVMKIKIIIIIIK